jgi:hypothetical protein
MKLKISMIITIGLIAVLCLAMATAYANNAASINFKGTVRYITVEGGFWGIVTEDGRQYEPTNLSNEYKQEGLPVQVTAVVKDSFNTHMWGTIVEISNVTKIESSK